MDIGYWMLEIGRWEARQHHPNIEIGIEIDIYWQLFLAGLSGCFNDKSDSLNAAYGILAHELFQCDLVIAGLVEESALLNRYP